MKTIYKWNVPVDDNWHAIGPGKVLLVHCYGGIQE